jgi:hypothetical protein
MSIFSELLVLLFEAHLRSAAVLVDELETGCFHGPAQRV